MTQTVLRIGPADHGRQMTLDDFDKAEVVEGCQVELGRGVVIVSEVPLPWHFLIVNSLRRMFMAYDIQHPGRICCVAGGGECKLARRSVRLGEAPGSGRLSHRAAV